ncbi:MAG: MFS transporter [Desulfuromusa sp.]|nr:MFS transporter [Desulfuromusa sp.]
MTILITLFVWRTFPQFPQKTVQHKHMLMRRRYWLYYALVFMSGARRQIFTVFAGFLMVEKFSYSVSEIALLFMVNAACNIFVAPQIGRLIDRVGERNALILEYSGLALIFCSYALVETGWIAAVLYVFDHLFFGLAISLKTYFQKIAAPADIASTAGVSFTINHIAAVVIPVVFGLIWLNSHAMVFYLGAVMAVVSLLLSILIPRHPEQGRETRLAIKPAT